MSTFLPTALLTRPQTLHFPQNSLLKSPPVALALMPFLPLSLWRPLAGSSRMGTQATLRRLSSAQEGFYSIRNPSCCRKGDLFLTHKSELLSNTQKWIILGGIQVDKARDFIGKGRPGGEQRGKGTRRTVLPCSRFYSVGVSFLAVSGQSFWLRVLPGGMFITQPRWMPARRILGGW